MIDTLIGGLIGFGSAAGTTVVAQFVQNWRADQVHKKRRELLKKMLATGESWRKLETLKRTIGADDETTIRLLLEIDARGSETGNQVWGLISRNPLPEKDAA